MTISTNVEISRELHDAVQGYLEQNPDWDHERVMQAALSLFLMQNEVGIKNVSQMYLDSLFGCES